MFPNGIREGVRALALIPCICIFLFSGPGGPRKGVGRDKQSESEERSKENGMPTEGSYRVPYGEYRIIRACFPPCTARQRRWRQAYQGRLQAGMIGLALLPSKSSLLLCALMEGAITAFMERAS